MTKKRDAYDEQLLRDYGLLRVRRTGGRLVLGFVLFLLLWIGVMMWLTHLIAQA